MRLIWYSLQAPQKIIASKRENKSKTEPSYRIQLLHYLGCYKHFISPTEFSGSICIYDDRVKHWFQCIDLLYDLGFCSTVVGKFICLHFEKLVKYYSVQTRTEQIPFTAPVDPVHFKSMHLLFVLLPDSKDELWHSRQQSTDKHMFKLKFHRGQWLWNLLFLLGQDDTISSSHIWCCFFFVR